MTLKNTAWIDLALAKRRLVEIEDEIEVLEQERGALRLALGGHADRLASAPLRPVRRAEGQSRSSLVDLIVDALRLAPPEGRSIQEIIRHIAAAHPKRVANPKVSSAISSAIAQAMRAHVPRIKVVTRGGRGVSSKYAVGGQPKR